MIDSDWLRFVDLQGKDVTVEIEKVVRGEVTGEGGVKSKKPVLYFKNKKKPLAIGATIGKTIESMYGADTSGWLGKRITLFTSTTKSKAGETVGCIRVRPKAPSASTQTAPQEPAPERTEE